MEGDIQKENIFEKVRKKILYIGKKQKVLSRVLYLQIPCHAHHNRL